MAVLKAEWYFQKDSLFNRASPFVFDHEIIVDMMSIEHWEEFITEDAIHPSITFFLNLHFDRRLVVVFTDTAGVWSWRQFVHYRRHLTWFWRQPTILWSKCKSRREYDREVLSKLPNETPVGTEYNRIFWIISAFRTMPPYLSYLNHRQSSHQTPCKLE